jgi:hypothetical protein
MLETLIRLFQSGAHHVVGGLIGYARNLLAASWLALRRRFGWLTDTDLPAAAELVRRVQQAYDTASQFGRRQSPLPSTYSINPALPQRYQYTIIGYLPNPAEPDKTVSIPWTINSDLPMSYEDVLQRAEGELNEAFDREDKYMGAEYADLHRRDILFQRIAEEQYGGHAPVDIVIREVYRRD